MELERRHLQHVAAVAFHGNVTQAAARLGISQPALSRSIRDLERSLGLRLFDRLSQGVVPTAAGTALLDRARPLLTAFEALEREAGRLGGVLAGEVAVGLGPAVAAGGAPHAITTLIRENPGLRCRITTASAPELVRALEHLELDFVVADLGAFDAHKGAIRAEALDYTGTFFCRTDHPVLRTPEALGQILAYPIAMLGHPPAVLKAVRDALRALDPALPADWRPALVTNDAGALAALMLENDVIGGSVPYAHADALRSGGLRPLPLAEPVYRGRVGPVRLRERSLSTPAERLWKTLVEVLQRDVAFAER